jgi:hypothetical protein
MLCKQAGSTDLVIIRRNPPSPHTLDRWSRAYREEGMSAFAREEFRRRNRRSPSLKGPFRVGQKSVAQPPV